MCEKVKSNIIEMAVSENLYLIPKRLIYLKQLLRYKKNRFTAAILENGRQRLQGQNLRWPYIQIFL